MALTLADQRKIEKNPYTKGFLDIILERNKLLQVMPIQNTTTMRQRILRWAALPTPTWRQLNQYYSASQGTTDWVEDTLYDVGGYVDVDQEIEEDSSNLKSPRAIQAAMWAKSLALEFNNVLLNGVSTSDQPDGIVARVATLAAAQRVDATAGNFATINAKLNPSASASEKYQFLTALNQALYALDNGDDFSDCVILVNQDTLLAFWDSLLRLGVLRITQDMYGREVYTYKGAKIIDAGRKQDGTTDIIATATKKAPIYCAKLGDDFLSMLQRRPLSVKDMGLQPGTVQYRTQIRWVWGLSMPHPRGLASISNVQVTD